jgi:hypothetical protein
MEKENESLEKSKILDLSFALNLLLGVLNVKNGHRKLIPLKKHYLLTSILMCTSYRYLNVLKMFFF